MNQNQLHKLNIDRFYVILLISSGLIILYSSLYNCFVVMALIYAVYILFGNKVKFAVIDPHALRIFLLMTGVFAGIAVYIIGFNDAMKISFSFAQESVRRFLLEVIPGTIYEEAVYRGMLYMFLIDLGVSKSKAFYIQAFLFWITHINYLLRFPFAFWIILPILSLTLGYIAMRSKSLTPSTFAHILYNTLVLFGIIHLT
jgi:membrane protease YdiL (CAAX protease family)